MYKTFIFKNLKHFWKNVKNSCKISTKGEFIYIRIPRKERNVALKK